MLDQDTTAFYDDSFLAADVDISCQSEYYLHWKVYGYFMIILYPIGIPSFYWYCLYSFREEILHRDELKKADLDDAIDGWHRQQ